MLKWISILVFGLVSCEPAKADETISDVWVGTIGKTPINACLDFDGNLNLGAYYYLNHLEIIRLLGHDNGTKWVESFNYNAKPADPTWHLGAPKGDSMSGEWTSGTQTLPIQLQRSKIKDGPGAEWGPCGSNAFVLPLARKPMVIKTKLNLEGHEYTKISVHAEKPFVVKLEAFMLNGQTDGINAINKFLTKRVPLDHESDEYLGCARMTLDRGARIGSTDYVMKPLILTNNWLVATEHDVPDCAQSKAWDSTEETVFDLRNGEKVDLEAYFIAAATSDAPAENDTGQIMQADQNTILTKPSRKHKPFRKLPRDLGKMIASHYSAKNEDCRGDADIDSWSESLTKVGVSFTPPSSSYTSCTESVTVGFADLQPFLTDEGNTKLAEFQSELPK